MRDIFCLRCAEKMRFLSRERIQLGKTGWVLGDLLNLLAGALDVEMYVCPSCLKLEFYTTEDGKGEDGLPQKTCPVCGAEHDFDYPKCPICKYDYYEK